MSASLVLGPIVAAGATVARESPRAPQRLLLAAAPGVDWVGTGHFRGTALGQDTGLLLLRLGALRSGVVGWGGAVPAQVTPAPLAVGEGVPGRCPSWACLEGMKGTAHRVGESAVQGSCEPLQLPTPPSPAGGPECDTDASAPQRGQAHAARVAAVRVVAPSPACTCTCLLHQSLLCLPLSPVGLSPEGGRRLGGAGLFLVPCCAGPGCRV